MNAVGENELQEDKVWWLANALFSLDLSHVLSEPDNEHVVTDDS
jgi:hypothetical protein